MYTHDVYTQIIIFSPVLETPGAKKTQNQRISAHNLTGLTPHLSEALSSLGLISIASIATKNQFSAGFSVKGGTVRIAKDEAV